MLVLRCCIIHIGRIKPSREERKHESWNFIEKRDARKIRWPLREDRTRENGLRTFRDLANTFFDFSRKRERERGRRQVYAWGAKKDWNCANFRDFRLAGLINDVMIRIHLVLWYYIIISPSLFHLTRYYIIFGYNFPKFKTKLALYYIWVQFPKIWN